MCVYLCKQHLCLCIRFWLACRASRILLQEWMEGISTRLEERQKKRIMAAVKQTILHLNNLSLFLFTSFPVLMERSLGLLLNLSFISISTLSSCCCCSVSVLQGVPHCRGEDDDMGRLGLGVPEAVLAEARKTALVRSQCSPAKLTDTAFEKPFGALLRIPSGTPFGASLRTPLGIPLSETYICWFGLLLGESSLELVPDLGLWLRVSEGQGVRSSRLVPSWQRGAGVGQELESWKVRRRCSRAGLVPETGRPRLRSCCLNSDTWGIIRVKHGRLKDSEQSIRYHLDVSSSECFQAFLTVRSTRFAGRSSGLDAVFVSGEGWVAVAGTGWEFRGMAPEDFTRSLWSPLKE